MCDRHISVKLLALFLTVLLIGTAGASQIYQEAGTYTWTCPELVKQVNLVLISGGGGGGAGGNGECADGGLGGEGGASGNLVAYENITVTPGTSYTIVVGDAGTAGVPEALGGGYAGGNGGNGGDSTAFGYTATGGAGGEGGLAGNGLGPGWGGEGGYGEQQLAIPGHQGENSLDYNTGLVIEYGGAIGWRGVGYGGAGGGGGGGGGAHSHNTKPNGYCQGAQGGKGGKGAQGYVSIGYVNYIIINSTASNTTSAYYLKDVRFKIINEFGNRVEGVNVTVQAYDSTIPEWVDNLATIFGVNFGVLAQTMTGSTGSDGEITYSMMPNVKYEVNIDHPSYESQELTLWPHEENYLITLYRKNGEIVPSPLHVNGSLSFETVDDNTAILKFNWSDDFKSTKSLNFTVWNVTPSKFGMQKDLTLLHTETCSGDCAGQYTYSVSKVNGSLYYWGYNCTHENYQTTFSATKYYRFEKKLVPIELDGKEIPDYWYNWICICLTVVVAGLFGAYQVRYAVGFTPWWAAFLKLIWGFSAVDWIFISIAIVLGTIYFIKSGEVLNNV